MSALLTAGVGECVRALGGDTVERFKHLHQQARRAAARPGWRYLRAVSEPSAVADPVAGVGEFAAAIVTSVSYYVDDHFIPYTGARHEGMEQQAGPAGPRRYLIAHDGRAVCFVTGEPSGLSVAQGAGRAEEQAHGVRARVRPRAAPARSQDVHWVTCRRASAAGPHHDHRCSRTHKPGTPVRA